MGMSPEETARRDKVLEIMAHMVQVGALLPTTSDLAEGIDDGDAALLAETEIVLAELAKGRAEIEAIFCEQEAADRAGGR